MSAISQTGKFTDWIARGGLRHCAIRMSREEATTVAFLGGSVTAGAGASDAERTSYRALICSYLQERFERVAFTFINAAIGGTDSAYGAFRLREHVLDGRRVDLLFVEFAVNDEDGRTKSVRAMEGIVRQAKRINPLIDICFVYTASRQGAEDYAASGKPQANIGYHEEVAARYELPSVEFASRIYRMIAAGALKWEEMSGDAVHPNDYGYSLYARYLRESLEELLQAVPAETAAPAPLPAPLDPFCYEQALLANPQIAELAEGWSFVRGWTNERVCNWTPPADVFRAEQAGARFRLRFTGTAAGLALLAGMETGGVDCSIDEGPYQTAEIFDRYCDQFYRPKIVLLADSLSDGPHTLDVRISQQMPEGSTGRSLHITRFLINGSASERNSSYAGGEAGGRDHP